MSSLNPVSQPEPKEDRTALLRGRLVAVSIRASMVAGGWVGFALGLFSGSITGAFLAWFAGAVLSWQRQLGLTLGVTEQLLPFGGQIPVLEWAQAYWFVLVPGTGLIFGLVLAIFGALVGGILAAAYNRSPLGSRVVIETEGN
jgi:hypothetical protein